MDPAGVSTGSTLRRFTQFALRQNLLPKRFKIAKKLRGRRADAEIVNRVRRVRPLRQDQDVSAPSGLSAATLLMLLQIRRWSGSHLLSPAICSGRLRERHDNDCGRRL